MNKIKSALLSTAVLGMAFLTNSAMADQQSDALVTKTPFDVSSKTFEVTAQQSVNGKAIKSIDVAVWSEENGQDDIKWYSSSNVSNGQVKVQFNLANHGNHAGNYNTHVYTNYTDGSRSGVMMENTLISPTASTLSLKDGGIRMTTDIYAPTNGTLYYAVWSEENDQDDIKWYADNGTGTTIADLKNHSGYGKYSIHTYVSQNGKMTGISCQDITINKQEISYQINKVNDNSDDENLSPDEMKNLILTDS